MIQQKRHSNTFSLFILSLTSCLILAQIGIILYAGNPLCLNQGCEIVEQLTLVPPLYINAAGIIYLQMLFWVLRSSRRVADPAHRLYQLLLLAGIAAEGVLISFQYLIANTFCSYCLVIFSCIVLLNLFTGIQQFFKAAVLFCTILITFSSLQFKQPAAAGSLTEGIFASREGSQTSPQLQLFFSAHCEHCENIIDQLADLPSLSVTFHPIDTISNFRLSQSQIFSKYSTAANRQILTTLGIKEVPVLFIQEEGSLQVLHGEQKIREKLLQLSDTGGDDEAEPKDTMEQPEETTGTSSVNDGCSVDEPCEDEYQIPGLETSSAY
ncbi:hypothetical protein [Desulfogranum japonicum]|uniref:hypothetical protein n=1 Tax=Desulfogranum japonicum TaxID=231447 RepID=UPI0004282DDB|nr:hypothetical protein [Desulfogranum japonicum]